ncbi:fibronectin type III domain-containing protein [bacterium]|nr:fibronectin type III domain-containing protein [bacterium]
MVKINKKIIILVALISGFLFAGTNVWAVSSPLSVEFQNDPLFKEANFLPGDSVTRWVKVTNNSGQTQKVLVHATEYTNPIPSDDLCHALMITISKEGTDLYGGSSPTGPKTLCDFYQDSNPNPIYLSDINNGQTIQYDFTVSFPPDKGNKWQGKTTYFDIVIGFEQEEGDETPGGGGSITRTTMAGGGGGGYTGLRIFNEETQEISPDYVTLTWFTNYPATSRVIYDTVSHSTIGAPPNYGYAFSTPETDTDSKVTFHSVTLRGLTPGVTYYWRAISRGSPETWGKELSFTVPTRSPSMRPSGPAGPGEGIGRRPTEGGVPLSEEERGGKITPPTPPEEGEGIARAPEVEISPAPKEEGVPPRKGFINWVGGGLASIIDALRNFLGRISICHLIILILILIILFLLYLLYKNKKKEKQTTSHSQGSIPLGPPSR